MFACVRAAPPGSSDLDLECFRAEAPIFEPLPDGGWILCAAAAGRVRSGWGDDTVAALVRSLWPGFCGAVSLDDGPDDEPGLLVRPGPTGFAAPEEAPALVGARSPDAALWPIVGLRSDCVRVTPKEGAGGGGMSCLAVSPVLFAAASFAPTLCVRFSGRVWAAGCPVLWSSCGAGPAVLEAAGCGSWFRRLAPLSFSAAPMVGRLDSVGSRDGDDCAGLRVGSGSCECERVEDKVHAGRVRSTYEGHGGVAVVELRFPWRIAFCDSAGRKGKCARLGGRPCSKWC